MPLRSKYEETLEIKIRLLKKQIEKMKKALHRSRNCALLDIACADCEEEDCPLDQFN